ncbi:YwbE family protein [Bacillus cytotoxicus]|uniref:YwbE family protein n=1 Tax=Bacillus cereus group TaxID=86661 RepID=UPI001F5941B3|nr:MULTISPECIES: YwbE family protein [Bacillus cereus group]MDH2877011.1 YwbE family protein [Bacillus cytotoxicus]
MEKKLFLLLLMSFFVIVLTACQGVHGSEKKEAQEEQRIEEEKRKQEEQRIEEEKRKQEEQRIEEEKRKQEEQRIEEEKRKQEEQRIEEKHKQEKQKQQSTQVRGGKPTRSQISIGTHVEIILDKDRRTRVSGVVKDILTHTETHPYGIKVCLQDGQIGRVQRIG